MWPGIVKTKAGLLSEHKPGFMLGWTLKGACLHILFCNNKLPSTIVDPALKVLQSHLTTSHSIGLIILHLQQSFNS